MELASPQQVHPNPIKNKTATIGSYLLDRLFHLGVHHIFGVPGDYILRFDKLIEQHPIEYINTTRENTAGYMADAYSRMRGLGAVCITYGVGINITNAISQSFVESSPLVVISGAPSLEEVKVSSKLHHLFNKSPIGHLDTTQLEIFKQITVDQTVLDNPETAQEDIDRVLAACLRHQKPVYIEIPRSSIDLPIVEKTHPSVPAKKTDPESLKEALEEISAILNRSRRPMIWIGHEIQRYSLVEPLLKFAEKYDIPILTTLLGKAAISERHPLFIGVYAGVMSRPEVSQCVENSDCLLSLGMMMSDVDTGIFSAHLKQPHQILANSESVRIDHHHYQVNFEDFIQGLSSISLKAKYPLDYIKAAKYHPPVFHLVQGQKATTKRLFECIQSHLKPEHVVVTDIGDCLFGAVDLILEQNSFLACAYFATLGFGVPGALGAQLALPKRRVIGIVGDGAFQMTGMELSTAVRYHLDPVIILLNNHGYATERPLIDGSFNDIQNWDYPLLTKVFGGGIGIKVTNEKEMDQAIKESFTKRGQFYLIEIDVEKMDFSPALQRFCERAKKLT